MRDTYGIILLDADEVIIRIYGKNNRGIWKLLRNQNYDLATFEKGKTVTAANIIEIIAEVSLSRTATQVTNWKIYGRNISEITIHDITSATGITTELLTLQREQELLCKGVLVEIE